ASFTVRVERPGHLRVEARARDARGTELRGATYFWAAGNRPLALAAEGLTLVPDKQIYAPGETAQLLVVSPLPGAQVLVTLEGRTLAGHRVLAMQGNALLVPLPLDAKDAPNLHVAA